MRSDGRGLHSKSEAVVLIPNWTHTKNVQFPARNQKALMIAQQKIAWAANEAVTAEEALRVCLENVCRYTGWSVGHASVIEGEDAAGSQSADVWYLSTHQRDCLDIEFGEIESLTSLLGRVLKERTAIQIADLWNDPQFDRSELARKIDLRAGSGFPIWCGQEIRGVLEFFSGQPMHLDASLRQLLANAGLQMGRVVDRARPKQSVSSLSALLLRTQDDERRRIARELHDSTGQYLVAIKLKLATARKTVTENSYLNRELAECCDLANECLKEIRTTSHLLHPPLLEELGLTAAIQCYVKGYAERSGIEVALEVNPPLGRLERDVEMAFFRIIQEALTNIHRHSGSRTARITVGRSISETFVEIVDSGKGMSQVIANSYENSAGRIGVGIAGMRERIRELGGRLEISSTSAGTIVRASVPQRKN